MLCCVLMGHAALVAALVRPAACLPSDLGYPECPWLPTADSGRVDIALIAEAGFWAALMLLPIGRLFVATFEKVRPPVGGSYESNPGSGLNPELLPFALPHQLIGMGGQFAHVENVRKAQALSRGFLFRRHRQKLEAADQPRRIEPPPVKAAPMHHSIKHVKP